MRGAEEAVSDWSRGRPSPELTPGVLASGVTGLLDLKPPALATARYWFEKGTVQLSRFYNACLTATRGADPGTFRRHEGMSR